MGYILYGVLCLLVLACALTIFVLAFCALAWGRAMWWEVSSDKYQFVMWLHDKEKEGCDANAE